MAVSNSSLSRGSDTGRKKQLLFFFLAEAIILSLFLLGQSAGLGLVATALLVAPFQIAAWAIMVKDEFILLMGFAALFPLSTFELLPYHYWRWVFYPVNLALFLFIIATRFLFPDNSDQSNKGKICVSQWILFVVFGAWVLITSIHALLSSLAVQKGALIEYTMLALIMIGVIFFFALVPRDFRQIKILISILVGSYIVTAPFLSFLKVLSLESLGGKTMLAPFGGYVNMNAVAVHVTVATLFLLGLVIGVKNLAGKLLGFLGVFILLSVLIITRSRGAWLGFALGLFYLLMRTRSKILLVITIIGLMLVFSMDLLRGAFLSRIGQTSWRDPSLAGRAILWHYALVVFKNNWFWGVGIENYRFVKHLYGFPAPWSSATQFNTHNIFLEILVDLGVFGLILFLGILLSAFISVERSLKVSLPENDFMGIASGVNAGLIAYAVHGLWDCLIWQHGAFILLGIILGLGLSIRRTAHCFQVPRTRN